MYSTLCLHVYTNTTCGLLLVVYTFIVSRLVVTSRSLNVDSYIYSVLWTVSFLPPVHLYEQSRFKYQHTVVEVDIHLQACFGSMQTC